MPDKLDKCYYWHIITLAKMKNNIKELKGVKNMSGYKKIKDLISDIDEFHNEAELREILQEILFICEDNIKNEPLVKWRGSANIVFGNWLNYCIYQNTPFMIENIKDGIVKQWFIEDEERFINNNNVTLLDTRTAKEFARGHIEGFKNIPVDEALKSSQEKYHQERLNRLQKYRREKS